ncbi:MAG: hypothetical protein L0L10_07870 [Tetragenococcus sp.]|nr:hypothetical protein [Tetragenococcus sp.]
MLQTKLQKIFDKYNGTLPTKLAIKEGLTKETLRKAYLRGDVEKPNRGVFVLPDAFFDDYFALQTTYSKGIYSHESALLLHELTTFSPFRYYMTFPKSYHTSQLEKNKIKPIYTIEPYYKLGRTEVKTWFGNIVRVYDKERTVLDMLASKHSSKSIIDEMWGNYLNDKDKDPQRLYAYAEKMNRQKLLVERNQVLA